jgi:hypothetical protein
MTFNSCKAIQRLVENNSLKFQKIHKIFEIFSGLKYVCHSLCLKKIIYCQEKLKRAHDSSHENWANPQNQN